MTFRPLVEGHPVDGIEFTLLPYDALGLLDSLESLAATRRPTFPALVDTLRVYTPPDPAEARDIHRLWLNVRNRVRALSDSLYRVEDRNSPEYAQLYTRFRQRYDDLVTREAALERALRAVSADHAALARRAMDAADSVRAWETTVFAQYDSLAENHEATVGRSSSRISLGTELTHPMTSGAWWLMARVPHPDNPFFEYLWYVPFHVQGLVPVSVPIRDHNITLQWRH